jgi:hypothetical protein
MHTCYICYNLTTRTTVLRATLARSWDVLEAIIEAVQVIVDDIGDELDAQYSPPDRDVALGVDLEKLDNLLGD